MDQFFKKNKGSNPPKIDAVVKYLDNCFFLSKILYIISYHRSIISYQNYNNKNNTNIEVNFLK